MTTDCPLQVGLYTPFLHWSHEASCSRYRVCPSKSGYNNALDELDIPCVPLYFEFFLGKGGGGRGATTYDNMVLINLEKGFPWVQELDFFPCLPYHISQWVEKVQLVLWLDLQHPLFSVFKIKFKMHNKKHPFITCTPVLKRITLRQFHHFPSLLCVRIVLLQNHPHPHPTPPQVYGAPNS